MTSGAFMPMSEQPVDVARLIDDGRWSGYQRWLVALVALTIVFDGIDNQLLGIVIPTVMKEWGVARSAFAPVVALGYLGMVIGGLAAGLAGDRLGRRTALLASMVVFGVMTVLASVVTSTGALGLLRLLAGIGLGGAMPNAAALAAEYVPLRQRPIAVTVTIVCVPLGGTLAGLLGIRLLPVLGWRMLFVYGGLVPLAAAFLLRGLLPESPRFLARHESRWNELRALMPRFGHAVSASATFVGGSASGVARASLSALFAPEWRRDTLALWAAFFFCLFSVYLSFSWLTSLLTGAGFDPGTANTGITAFNLGGVAGALIGGFAIPRVGSRTAMLTMAGIAITCAAVLSSMTITPAAGVMSLVAMLTLTGGVINGVQTTMYALAAHVYPSTVRATGVGTAVAIGRFGAILTGYVGPWAIELRGTTSFFAVIAVTMAVTFVALASVKRHVAARAR
jgi:AAHS family 4-hydroxybenzoate transporter-like MFS transporter